MTVLAEEVAALRRAVAAQAVMLKEVMGAVDRPHDTLKELNLRLQVLENWQIAMSTPDVAPPSSSRAPDEYSQQINDLQAQKARLIFDIDWLMRDHKRGIARGGIWELITALDAVLCRYRVDERA